MEHPTAEEFEEWLLPTSVWTILHSILGQFTAEEVVTWLVHDELVAAARKVSTKEGGRYLEPRELAIIPPRTWEERRTIAEHGRFWRTGTLEFEIKSRVGNPTVEVTCIDVRFEPTRVEFMRTRGGKPKGPTVPEIIDTDARQIANAKPNDAVAAPSSGRVSAGVSTPPSGVKNDRPRLSDGEMKRFSQMVVDTYGKAVAEIPTYGAICALFPKNFVPRDHFLAIFREIRGEKSRGRSKLSGK